MRTMFFIKRENLKERLIRCIETDWSTPCYDTSNYMQLLYALERIIKDEQRDVCSISAEMRKLGDCIATGM